MRTDALSSLVNALVYQRGTSVRLSYIPTVLLIPITSERFHELVESCMPLVIRSAFEGKNTITRLHALNAIEYLRNAWLNPPYHQIQRRKSRRVFPQSGNDF